MLTSCDADELTPKKLGMTLEVRRTDGRILRDYRALDAGFWRWRCRDVVVGMSHALDVAVWIGKWWWECPTPLMFVVRA